MTSVNIFIKQSQTTTELGNNALKYTTLGNDFIDQFSKISNYREPRSYSEVAKDMELLWFQDPKLTISLTFYIRLITRKTQLFDGNKLSKTQRGQGLKNEGIMRMFWLYRNHKKQFEDNIILYLSAGCWNDLFVMAEMAILNKLDVTPFYEIATLGLVNPETCHLVCKYLPNINSKKHKLFAKGLAKFMWGNISDLDKTYRKTKSAGEAHTWQQAISQRRFDDINFDKVHGRALNQMVSNKFLTRQQLEDKYIKWIESKPELKFTGYVYELFKNINDRKPISNIQKATYNKQFAELVSKAKTQTNTRYIGVLDSSGSMEAISKGTSVSAYTVAKSMCLFLSHLMDDTNLFREYYLEFSDSTELHKWKGQNPIDQYQNANSRIIAGTNFQSVADHFVNMKNMGVDESQFPTGIVCFSDGCFDASPDAHKTNYQVLMKKLKEAKFSDEYVANFKVILWDVVNDYYEDKSQSAFEDMADTPNLYHFGGLDPAVITFMLEGKMVDGKSTTPKDMNELFTEVMEQEIMKFIKVDLEN